MAANLSAVPPTPPESSVLIADGPVSFNVEPDASPPLADNKAKRRLAAVVNAISFTTFIAAQRKTGTLPKSADEAEDSDAQQAALPSPSGTARSLVNAIVSAGVLGLADEIQVTGSGTYLLLLAFSAFAIHVTMMFLFKASLKLGTTSYVQTAEQAWGKVASRVVLASVCFGQAGTLIAYFNVLSDTLPWVLQQLILGCVEGTPACDEALEGKLYLTSAFIIIVLTCVLIVPISCLSNPDVFAKISFTTFVHFALFAGLVLYGLFEYGDVGEWPETSPSRAFRISGNTAVSAAIMAFAMAAHTTCMPLFHGTALPPTSEGKERSINWVVTVSVVSVAAYYAWVSLLSFGAFAPDGLASNSLKSFPGSDVFANIVRTTYTLEIATSIPMYTYALRRNLSVVILGLEGSMHSLDQAEAANYQRTVVFTVVLLAVACTIGLLGSLGLILGFTGCIAAALNVYIFPSALYWTAGCQGWDRILAPFFVVMGALVGSIALYSEIKAVVDGEF